MDFLPIPEPFEPPENIQPQNIQNQISGLNRIDLVTEIWEATESFCSPDLLKRMAGFERLIEYDAVRQLPLVVYLFVSRLIEPDIELRTRIVKMLGTLANANTNVAGPTEDVLRALMTYVSAIRTREIFALLQIVEYDKSTEGYVADLLSLSSFAGSHLSQLLSDRALPIEIRRQAAYFIGLIGYLDALPVLERLASRLENRGDGEDISILPVLQNAVQLLTAP